MSAKRLQWTSSGAHSTLCANCGTLFHAIIEANGSIWNHGHDH
jgi:hypothetical protein